MKRVRWTFWMAMVASLVGCSTQWRESDPGIDATTLFEIIDEALPQASASSSGSSAQDFLAIVKDDIGSTIFFAEGPGSMGSAQSILAFYHDLTLFGKPNRTREEVQSVVVMLAEGYKSETGPLSYALLVDIVFNDGERSISTFSSIEERQFVDKEFTVTLRGTTGDILIRSLDVSDGELKKVIQLQVYQQNQSGEYLEFGKFSTLVAFEP